MAWTDEMVDELKRLWSQGVTTGEIGRRLGISKNSIVGKVHRLGLEGRPSPIKKSGGEEKESAAKPTKSKSAKDVKPKSDKKGESDAKKQPTVKTKAIKEEKKVGTESELNKRKVVSANKEADMHKKEPLSSLKPQANWENKVEAALPESVADKRTEKVYRENISLTELDNHTCRWPLGDPKDDDFRFCGRKVKTGQTYCEEHSAVAYVKPIRK